MSAASERTKPATRFQLRGCIVAYTPGLMKAKSFNEGSEPKFGASFILPASKAVDMSAQVETALMEAAAAKWGDRERWPPRLRGPAKEPVLKAVADFPSMMEDPWPGAVFVRAGGKDQPGFVDAMGRAMTPEQVASVIYSGWIVNASFTAFAYEQQTGAGVSLGLNNVQLVRPGKRIGGRVSAASEFGAVPDEELEGGDDEI